MRRQTSGARRGGEGTVGDWVYVAYPEDAGVEAGPANGQQQRADEQERAPGAEPHGG